MRKLLSILILALTFCGSATAAVVEYNDNTVNYETVLSHDINPELMQMLKSGEILSLSIAFDKDFACTLSAEVSYNGAAIKLSITADTCEEAGAGLAQAVRGFYKEIQ